MLNCMIFWQTPHALDIYIYRSVHFVILQNGTTGGLMCWICGHFLEERVGLSAEQMLADALQMSFGLKKTMFYSTNFQLTNLKRELIDAD